MTSRIKFSARWDKLGEARFTTFRRHRPDKEAYYRRLLGKTFDVVLVVNEGKPSYREELLAPARLVDVYAVVPQAVPSEVLEHDVQFGGAVDATWLNRILALPLALRLTFVTLVRRSTWNAQSVSPGQLAGGR